MKSNSLKRLLFSKISISNLSTILGGNDGGAETTGGETGGTEQVPSTAGRSWNCDSKKVCH